MLTRGINEGKLPASSIFNAGELQTLYDTFYGIGTSPSCDVTLNKDCERLTLTDIFHQFDTITLRGRTSVDRYLNRKIETNIDIDTKTTGKELQRNRDSISRPLTMLTNDLTQKKLSDDFESRSPLEKNRFSSVDVPTRQTENPFLISYQTKQSQSVELFTIFSTSFRCSRYVTISFTSVLHYSCSIS